MSLNGLSQIISAMPGCGKSYCMANSNGLRIADSDSQNFHYLTNQNGDYVDVDGNVIKDKNLRVKNPNFLIDYMRDIECGDASSKSWSKVSDLVDALYGHQMIL